MWYSYASIHFRVFILLSTVQLALAAGSVLSVLQCPPRTPTFLTSSLLLLSSSNDNSDLTSTTLSIPTTNSSETTTKTLLEQQQQLHHQKCLQLSSSAEDANQQGLIHFLRNICVQAAVTELALVISLIYVDRLKKVLSSMARGDPDTPFKIMLSALLVVKKVICCNDRIEWKGKSYWRCRSSYPPTIPSIVAGKKKGVHV